MRRLFTLFLLAALASPVLAQTAQPAAQPCAGRLVRHDYGQTCVPLFPRRVVVIDETALDIALALEIKPVGRARPNLIGDLERLYGSRLEGVADLGLRAQPNLETLLTLRPDLILTVTSDPTEYARYARLAPTLAFEIDQTGWKSLFRRVAEALGRKARADLAVVAFERRARAVRTAIGEARTRGLEVGMVQVRRNLAQTRFRTRASFPGTVFSELGFAEPRQQRGLRDGESPYFLNVSLERLDLLDADVLFVAVDPGSEASSRQVFDSPLWRGLRAVRTGQVFTVPSDYWVFGSINAANAMLNDIEKALVRR